MNDAVVRDFHEYLELTGDRAAAANLVLAAATREHRPAAPLERPMTVPEVAKFLRVTPPKVLRWIRGGELSAVNVATRPSGRPRFRVSPADLAAFQQRRANLTTPVVARRATRRAPRPFPKTLHPTT